MNEREKAICQLPTESLMGLSFLCSCGQTHTVAIQKLVMKQGAIGESRSLFKELQLTGKAGIIYDKKIEKTVIVPVLEQFTDQGIDYIVYPFGNGHSPIYPEISNGQKIAEALKGKVNFLISIGSGVISDLTKYAATLLEIPSILVATAPSMNGYTSTMAALTYTHVKKTLPIKNLTAIIADIDILKDAPIEMIRSGLGDIVSRAVCIADWKLASRVKTSYFCEVPFYLTDIIEQNYIKYASSIGERNTNGIQALTEGIMRSGLSMTLIGTSTPSSGLEHVISHYWDLIALIENKPKLFHGVQVGVATPMALRFIDFVMHYPVRKKINLSSLQKNYLSSEEIHQFMLKKFKKYGEGVYNIYKKKYMDWKHKKVELEYILDNWIDLWDQVTPYLRPIETVEPVLQASGAAWRYTDIGKSREEAIDAIINGHLIRSRYTVLDLAHDLGISLEGAEKITP